MMRVGPDIKLSIVWPEPPKLRRRFWTRRRIRRTAQYLFTISVFVAFGLALAFGPW